MHPIELREIKQNIANELVIEFEGTGFVLKGAARKVNANAPEKVLSATLYIDGEEVEKALFPTDFTTRRLELFWKYQLPQGKHTVKIVADDLPKGYYLRALNCLIYTDESH